MFWALAAVCCATLLPFIGLPDFYSKGEPREAVVAFSMLEQHDWLLPVNNGGEIPYKPPMFHWLMALFGLLNGGHVDEYVSRLPSALALIGLTLLTFSAFSHKRGGWFGVAAAAVAFSSWELHRAGMNCRVDMVLTFFTVAAIFLMRRRYFYGKSVAWIAILMMSAATLTKGPVGILVPSLVVGIAMLMQGVPFWRAFLRILLWGVLALIIPALWYLAAYGRGGQEFLDLVMEENFGRMTNTMAYDSCVHPWPYNIGVLLAGFLPWTLLALLALFLVRFGKKRGSFRAWWRSLAPETLLSISGAVVVFVFYCIPQSKRSVYLMPMYPFLAYFMVLLGVWIWRRVRGVVLGFGDFFAGAACLLFAAFLAVKFGLVPDSIVGHGKHAPENLAMLRALREIGWGGWIWVLVSPAAAVVWWVWAVKWLKRNRTGENHAVKASMALTAVAAVVVSIYVSLAGAYQPAVLNVKSMRPVAAQIAEVQSKEGGRLYEFISRGVFSKGDPVHYFELNYYLGNRIGNFYKDRPAGGLLLLSDEDAEKYFPEFEREGYRFEKVWTSHVKLLREDSALWRFTRRPKE